MWILLNFSEHSFYRTPPDDCFYFGHAALLESHKKDKNSSLMEMLWKKVYLKISHNSQESACARESFM